MYSFGNSSLMIRFPSILPPVHRQHAETAVRGILEDRRIGNQDPYFGKQRWYHMGSSEWHIRLYLIIKRRKLDWLSGTQLEKCSIKYTPLNNCSCHPYHSRSSWGHRCTLHCRYRRSCPSCRGIGHWRHKG